MGNLTIKRIEFRFHIPEYYSKYYLFINIYQIFFFFVLIDTMVNQDSNEKEDLSMHSSLLNTSDLAQPTTNDSHILSFGMSPGT